MERSSRSSSDVRLTPTLLAAESSGTAAHALLFPTTKQPNIFARLSTSQRSRVIARGVRLHLSKGEALFAQGERHKGVYLIEGGLIRTCYTSPAGREITLAYWQPGNIVGTPQVFGTQAHQWSGIAAAETTALAFRGEDIFELIQRIPNFAIAVVETLEFKGKCLSALVQMLGTRSVAERLAMLLYDLAKLHGVKEKEGIAIGQPFTHEVLAHMVGASRQWVTMTLDSMQGNGLVRVEKRRIVILQPDKLLSRPSGGSRYDVAHRGPP
jgi:CRP/FNR family transcriptional regulator, cyclic AMP receptor protein